MPRTYRNPVYPFDFADPFILQTGGHYYAYGTASPGEDGKAFPVLESANLVDWKRVGGALVPLTEPEAVSYWAPEVIEKDGRYYLFFSASTSQSDADHRLRVATADKPVGPFLDSGAWLLPQIGFSIDANPFYDPISQEFYLYFAMDYETDPPTGTGLAVVKLADDLMSVTTAPTPVLRAQAAWQVYERNRHYKGLIWKEWNCVEGPDVLYHSGKYYCFYSGGAWNSENYGVGCAQAEHPLGPWRDTAVSDLPNVLKGIPGKVIGPGHCSHVRGPTGNQLYMVYHAWDPAKTARRMCIDPIHWTHDGPQVDGPSTQTREMSE